MATPEEKRQLLNLTTEAAIRLALLAARIEELHPYDLPEVLALPAVGGSESYLEWVRTETTT